MASGPLLDKQITKYTAILAAPLSILVAFILVHTNTETALMVAIGVGVLVMTFINTDFAIYTLIFSMLLSPEFGSRSTTGEGITIRIDDIISAIILFTWLAKMALYKELAIFKKTPLNKPMGLYIFICFVSTGFGAMAGRLNPAAGFFFVLKYIQFFLIYFMVINHVRSKKQIDNYILSILITYVIVVIVALSQIPRGYRLTAPFEGHGGEPNTLGGYLIMIIAINLALVLTPGILAKPVHRRLLITTTAISVIPFLLTNSRGSWVSAIPVIIAFVVLSQRRYIVVGWIVFFIIVAPLVLPDTVIDRVRYTFQEQQGYSRTLQEEVGGVTLDTSASERVRSWKLAFEEFPQHPILGFGVTGWRFLDAQFIRVLIETGLLGLYAFVRILALLLKNVWKIHKEAKIPFFRAYALGFYIAIIAMLTHSIGANTFIIIRIMEPFWLIAGLVMSIPYIEEIELEKLRQMEDRATLVKMGVVS